MWYPYIKQLDQKDCGVTCLAMIFKSNGMEIPIRLCQELCVNGKIHSVG
ncbi:hypothetical protein CBF34_05115 [Vagococcus penaei]|nr:cysteine peptidase family C39 domain-containing protein [Vagococcus penaei]RSU02903.1 hypothetical protein CBF34_05115 [Vagococcus penaei]